MNFSVGDNVIFRKMNDSDWKLLEETHGKWIVEVAKSNRGLMTVLQLTNNNAVVRLDNRNEMTVDCLFLQKVFAISSFRIGDTVRMDSDEKVVKKLQLNHGGWNSLMNILLGEDVKISGFVGSTIVKVEFLGMQFNVNRTCLIKKSDFAMGQKVRLLSDKNIVRNLQNGHGEWIEEMESFLGKTGVVLCSLGDTIVNFGNDKIFQFNSKCLYVDDEEMEEEHVVRLQETIEQQNITIISQLISPKFINKISTTNGLSPFMVAIKLGNMDIIQLTMNSGADPMAGTNDGFTAIHFAASIGKHEVLPLILPYEGAINVCTDDGKSPLMVAVENKHIDCCRAIMAMRNVHLNIKNKCGNTALHLAILKRFNPIAADLIVAGASLTDENSEYFSPFHLAVTTANDEIVKIMLENNSTLINSQKSNDKFSALHLSAFNGFVNILQILLDKNADVNIRNSNDETPLHLAAQKCFNCVDLLCSKVSDMNAQDKQGNTALHRFLKKIRRNQMENSEKILHCLLESGCTASIANNLGVTCFDIGRETCFRSSFDLSYPDRRATETDEETSKTLKNKLETFTTQKMCPVCMDGTRTCVIDCGHSFCECCLKKISRCPICRHPIETKIKLIT